MGINFTFKVYFKNTYIFNFLSRRSIFNINFFDCSIKHKYIQASFFGRTLDIQIKSVKGELLNEI